MTPNLSFSLPVPQFPHLCKGNSNAPFEDKVSANKTARVLSQVSWHMGCLGKYPVYLEGSPASSPELASLLESVVFLGKGLCHPERG